MKTAKLFAACLIALSTTSCGAPSDACGWLTMIHPDPGFEQRWTRSEKEQVAVVNRVVDRECR